MHVDFKMSRTDSSRCFLRCCFSVSNYFTLMSFFLIRAWPDMNSIDQKWRRVQIPLFELLCSERVVYSRVQGGKWLSVGEATLANFPENDPKELLVQVFLAANQNVATLPEHVLRALELYTNVSTGITPSLTRRVLRQTPVCYRSLSRLEKIQLLKFVLKDEQFSDLFELELLPVTNERFVSFSNTDQAVYISSPEHPLELLPGLKDQFLDQDIDVSLFQSLQAVSKQGTRNVVCLFLLNHVIALNI